MVHTNEQLRAMTIEGRKRKVKEDVDRIVERYRSAILSAVENGSYYITFTQINANILHRHAMKQIMSEFPEIKVKVEENKNPIYPAGQWDHMTISWEDDVNPEPRIGANFTVVWAKTLLPDPQSSSESSSSDEFSSSSSR